MNKQVEEMAKDICPFHEYENCEQCDTELDIGDEPCLYKMMAKEFIEKDYRRALDVAREIFAEIDRIIEVDKYGEAKLDVRELYKLQKKYESEGEG